MRYRTIGLYTLALPVVITAAFSAAAAAFKLTESLPWKRMPEWTVLALNFVPPFVAGVIVCSALAGFVKARGWFDLQFRNHLERCAIAYVLSVAIIVVIIQNRANSDFGLWSQAIEWPLASMIGMITTDFVWLVASRKR